MFFTFRAKMVLTITVILVVTAALIMFFTRQDVGRAMLSSQEEAIFNVSTFIQLNIQREYRRLLLQKVEVIQRRKQQLKALAETIGEILGEYSRNVGQLQGKQGDRRTPAIAFLKSVISPNELYWTLYGDQENVVAHAGQRGSAEGMEQLPDMKGRRLGELIQRAARMEWGEYAVFERRDGTGEGRGRELTYFRRFSPWKWTISTGIDISDIDLEVERKRKQVISVLKKNFRELKIAGTGFAFLFTGEKEILIPPPDRAFSLLTAADSTGAPPLLDDLIGAARQGTTAYEFVSMDERGGEKMVAYTRYFKGFDWYTVIILPLREIHEPALELITRQLVLIGCIFVVSLLVIFFLVAAFTAPLKRLTASARKLPFQDFTTLDEGDDLFSGTLTARRDEIGNLALSFSFMQKELRKNIRALVEVTAVKQRMASELDVAREIQLGILPKTFPPFPDCHHFDIFARMRPAKEVGGDLYDFFFVDETHLCFTLGDVSEKGVPAALFMVKTMTLVKTLAHHVHSPAEMMEQINAMLCVDNPNSMFVTLVIGLLDLQTGEIRYANGGHNPPVLLGRDGPRFQKEISGPVVGALEEMSYTELSVRLQPGEGIFLYTDGVTEAMDEENKLYSDGRLLRELAACRQKSPKETLHRIMDSVDDHVGSAPQSDDIAMLMIRYLAGL